ncbi:hypothetical protein ALNOE001_02840 [Candidatus Methanobinarius endosymbioticus]|uniref:Periplasmic copper-binding protein NosD beta helix domain-containing protein n=1 Tax=Candidatus Methanobinarius endosymbioticus TaxID=2006182 RepID=A0A366MDM6_9EURY|nr:hypothetical protein ALNOE001_02840 [Candidatus Methanobinarius endosymbioticus]
MFNNSISKNGYGVFNRVNGIKTEINNNKLIQNDYGIYNQGQNAIINQNTISNNKIGILTTDKYTNINKNTINNNQRGLYSKGTVVSILIMLLRTINLDYLSLDQKTKLKKIH